MIMGRVRNPRKKDKELGKTLKEGGSFHFIPTEKKTINLKKVKICTFLPISDTVVLFFFCFFFPFLFNKKIPNNC